MARHARENPGCLGMLLRLFGISPQSAADGPLPYRTRDDFLSPAEQSFYRVLRLVIADRAAICAKVNLGDLFFVIRPNENLRFRSKIAQKHVDFLLCDKETMKPLAGIELDDRSHARPDRQERDAFVDEVFQAAGLPLEHVVVKQTYTAADLATRFARYLDGAPAAAPPQPVAPQPVAPQVVPHAGVPNCPKCGTPMKRRTATQGERKGEQFWGCTHYPKCREMLPYDEPVA